MQPFAPGKPYWWQWPTILSLDAPAVVLLWQALLARANGAALHLPHRVVLGASVWLAYAADRWIEGWRLAPNQVRTQRHYFYQHARWPLAVLWLAVAVTDVGTAWRFLSRREFAAGLLLLGPVLAYLLSHQLAHRHHPWRVPKEFCVAALLAGGVALFPALQLVSARGVFVAAVALFALLCVANCALISTWESGVDVSHGQTSLALQYRRAAGFSRALPWALAAIAGGLCLTETGPLRTVAACAATSALLLGGVDRLERRTGWQLARVLADAALMTPLLPLVAIRGS